MCLPRHLKRLSEYQTIRPENLIQKIEEKTIFVGDGVKTYGEDIKKSLPSLSLFPTDPFHLPHGSTVARLGRELLLKGEYLELSSFTPIYVRPSEAEIKWQEKHSN
jgi:tRNA threonylcarbamoyladenosine biosynthesis protein TsaB